jgi:hypothetical protein
MLIFPVFLGKFLLFLKLSFMYLVALGYVDSLLNTKN